MNQKSSSRHFLKGAVGGLGGVIAAHVAGFFPEAQPLLAQAVRDTVPSSRPISREIDVGESFAGFFLLPEGAPVPNFVQPSKHGIPAVCGIGADSGGAIATAISETYHEKNVFSLPTYLQFDFCQL